jgi:hypothetical protein
MDARYVFCAGMYRSGSTWQYAVVCHLLERYRGGRRLGFVSGDDFAGRDAGRPPGGWRVLKVHDADPSFAAALAGRRALAVYSYRDLRDVAFSLAHKYRVTFEEVVEGRGMLRTCMANDAFWASQPGTLCQRYEEMIEEPARAVAELAEHLGLRLETREAEEIAAEFSLAANRRRAAELAGRLRAEGVDLDDPRNALRSDADTLLHWNHIRDGRPGRWREQATPRQLAVLVDLCTDWLVERGYAWDSTWWAEAVHDPARSAADLRRQLGDAQRVLNGAVPGLTRAEAELAGLRPELRDTRTALEATRAELEVTSRRLAEHEDHLRRALLNLMESERARVRLENLGPFALGIAGRIHAWSVRHPRLAAAARRLLGWRGTRPPCPAT